MKRLTVNTVQGVGDIFWVYQKIAPHCDTLDLIINIVSDDVVQKRSYDFIKQLPKVGNITWKLVSSVEYDRLAALKVRLSDVIEKGSFDWAANKWLEDGVRLDEIDSLSVAWDCKFQCVQDWADKDYFTFYTSGHPYKEAWNAEQWAQLLTRINKAHPNKKWIFLGANYDKTNLEKVATAAKMSPTFVVNQDASKAISVLKGSSLHVGYQSGLSIIADNYDVKQLMVYFNFLKPMLYTWCKRGNIKTKFFATTFDVGPEGVPGDFLG